MKYLDESEMLNLLLSREKDFAMVEYFVKKYGIDAVDRDGRDLLMNFILERDENTALKLIDAYKEEGLDINRVDFYDWTPLHFAVQEHLFSVIEKLIASGASINAQEEDGRTPLFIAIYDRLPDKTIQYMIKHGADIDIPNHYGVNAREFLNKALEKWIRKQSAK